MKAETTFGQHSKSGKMPFSDKVKGTPSQGPIDDKKKGETPKIDNNLQMQLALQQQQLLNAAALTGSNVQTNPAINAYL